MQSEQTTNNTASPAFDLDTLTGILDGKQAPLINELKKLLSTEPFHTLHGEEKTIATYREQVLQWCQLLAEKGYGAIGYPEAYGGKNDMEAYFTVMETLSYHDLSLVIKFGVQFGLWGMSILSLGTEKHYNTYLRGIGNLSMPGCFAMTETNHGSDVKGLETTATYNHATKTFTIHTPHEGARKEYIGNAAQHGIYATVFAQLIIAGKNYGVNAFVVPIRTKDHAPAPGITIKDCGKKMGLNGVDNGIIYFSHVTIPRENMLDRFASINDSGQFVSPIESENRRFFTMLGTLVGGRIGVPRSALAASKTALTIAIQYAATRRQFGADNAPETPILDYRIHQRRLLPLLANTYACHFALQYVTKRFVHRKENKMQEIEALAAGLKAFTTWHTTSTIQECRECCGGKGYMSENRMDDLKNDTDVFTTFEGDNTVLMQLVAKSRLSEFRQEFGDMNMFSIVTYLADQAKTALIEKNPITIRNTSEEHLLSAEFHWNAFKYREREILSAAARRLKKHLEGGMHSLDAFNVCQHHLINMAQAYIEFVVLEQFQAQVQATTDPKCKKILEKLCQLFALSQIEKNRAWYLEQNYMEGVKTKSIRKLVNQLCWDLRKDAVHLVKAFAIPATLIQAPIAFQTN